MRNTATGRGFWYSDVTPKWSLSLAPAPLGKEDPIVTLKFMRMTVAEMRSFLDCKRSDQIQKTDKSWVELTVDNPVATSSELVTGAAASG